jgi:acyl-CoA reductase-like NAD-dependent aldehyde dehydrogenase
VADCDSMILRKASAALAAGCCMIVKPSPETPLSVLALANLAEQAGFPKGVFSVLTTSLENTPPLSEALCRHPLIKKVTFTGSVSRVECSSLGQQTDILSDKSGKAGREVVFGWPEKGYT